jgi:hypothetical protein
MLDVLGIMYACSFSFIRRCMAILSSRLPKASLIENKLYSLRASCSYDSAYLSLL